VKVLLIRMDRLGDLVCTLPVDQHPKITEQGSSSRWLISKGLSPVLECTAPARNFWSIDLKFSWQNFTGLLRTLRKEDFDKVILFYAPWWVALACLVGGIPQRYSPRSRWFQILFFNKTLRQNRSRSTKHEAEYNWDLLHWALTGEAESPLATPTLKLQSHNAPPFTLPESFVVIHPGMGGSALNWPSKHYLELAKKLSAAGPSVLITGTAGDLPWLTELEAPLKAIPNVHWLVGKFDLKTLIYVLSKSRAVVAPSTGVIHLAASTGVKTLGIYSPIRVQTPTRWSPRGLRSQAFAPSVECPATTKCLGPNCKFYACLDLITPEQIFNEIQRP
jgi:heptosyltransferase I